MEPAPEPEPEPAPEPKPEPEPEPEPELAETIPPAQLAEAPAPKPTSSAGSTSAADRTAQARAQPRWVPDADAERCMLCTPDWRFRAIPGWARHHCRSCGWVVCASCAPKSQMVELDRWVAPQQLVTAAEHGMAVQLQRVCSSCAAHAPAEVATWWRQTMDGSLLAVPSQEQGVPPATTSTTREAQGRALQEPPPVVEQPAPTPTPMAAADDDDAPPADAPLPLGDDEFPDEVLALICCFLGLWELGRLACVARRFTEPTLTEPGGGGVGGAKLLSPIEEGAWLWLQLAGAGGRQCRWCSGGGGPMEWLAGIPSAGLVSGKWVQALWRKSQQELREEVTETMRRAKKACSNMPPPVGSPWTVQEYDGMRYWWNKGTSATTLQCAMLVTLVSSIHAKQRRAIGATLRAVVLCLPICTIHLTHSPSPCAVLLIHHMPDTDESLWECPYFTFTTDTELTTTLVVGTHHLEAQAAGVYYATRAKYASSLGNPPTMDEMLVGGSTAARVLASIFMDEQQPHHVEVVSASLHPNDGLYPGGRGTHNVGDAVYIETVTVAPTLTEANRAVASVADRVGGVVQTVVENVPGYDRRPWLSACGASHTNVRSV
eukprot:COSAG06_NODE_6873_length_2734_cov_3.146110_3_plen_603_part_00